MTHSQGPVTVESPQEFSDRINLPFKNILLLRRALTHRSYMNEHPHEQQDNERLEYLGDAVLDYVVSYWLFNNFPEMQEGELTRVRSALVNKEKLAEFARQIDLGKALRLGRGEEDSGGRDRDAILHAGYEALLGALCLDQDVAAVEEFFGRFIDKAVKDVLNNRQSHDYKSRLQEWVQSQGGSTPKYQVVDSTGPDHKKTFIVEVVVDGKVLGSGEGSSKQEASKAAAQAALIELKVS